MHRFPATRILLLALVLASPVAGAGSLRGAQLQAQGSRVVLELDGSASYKVFTLAHPDRLVLDLPGSRLAPGFRLPAPDGLVAGLRTGQPTPDVLRVVVDLGGAVTATTRVERGSGRSRLVVELRGKEAAAMPEPLATAAAVPVPVPAPVVADVAAVASDRAVAEGESPPVRAGKAPTKTLQDVLGSGLRELVVAIDAGHGGKDPGALGPAGVQEKKVTLAVARELARQIDADPGMKAVLIRESDVFVPLQQRYMKARGAQADLFISIHADAAPSSAASGASVYVLSTRGASSQAARWLADQENAADLVGGVSLDDKDRSLSAVLLDLSQSATMRASDDIAEQVLGALKKVGKAHKPGVERANFVVLRSPDVPSMLIETGFITNPGEEKKLDDPDYRQRLAAAISDGVRQYFSQQPPPGTWYAVHRELRPATREYVVGRGETLSLIAARHGVPVDSLREANRKRNDSLRVGERLTIPLFAGAPE